MELHEMSKYVKQGSIDPASLRIVDEEYVGKRAAQGSKYDEIFSVLRQGQRLACGSGHAGRLSQQLREWLRQRGIENPLVRSKERCDDGDGGVWWLGQKDERTAKPAKPVKLKTKFVSGNNPFEQLAKRAA